MPETKRKATARAKRLGFPKSNVVKAEDDGHFIAPHGITSADAKKAYANCRAKGNNKEKCAKIAWIIQNKSKK